MDHIFKPLCKELKINYQPLTGMFSYTRVVDMLDRSKKPLRILYISDFDPAGQNMPSAFAENLYWGASYYAKGIDIKMTHLALTAEQVKKYDLPANVMDEKNPYNAAFIAEHGAASTELDALEATHPGLLEQMVRDAVETLTDHTLRDRCAETEREAKKGVLDEWWEFIAPEEEQLEDLDKRDYRPMHD